MKIQRIAISLIFVLVVITNPASAHFSENSRQGSPAISAEMQPASILGNPEQHQGLSLVLLELVLDSLFITKDKIGFRGGRNLFSYCRNNPAIYTDPFGLRIINRFVQLSLYEQTIMPYTRLDGNPCYPNYWLDIGVENFVWGINQEVIFRPD